MAASPAIVISWVFKNEAFGLSLRNGLAVAGLAGMLVVHADALCCRTWTSGGVWLMTRRSAEGARQEPSKDTALCGQPYACHACP